MISNDERGWILASVSGLACVFGACLINFDIILHIAPRWRSFSIRESSTFLAASLSLSFGVMFFSALYGLLPEARKYFVQHGYRPDAAGYSVIGFFLTGVLGLQLVSETLHRCLPSSIVSCDDHGNGLENGRPGGAQSEAPSAVKTDPPVVGDEHTPLLDHRQPSLTPAATSFLSKKHCAQGKYYGYSDHLCDLLCDPEHTGADSETVKIGSPHAGTCSPPAPGRFGVAGAGDGSSETYTSHGSHQDNIDGSIEDGMGHHHIPKNKFLSIGVQTSIAIALHKFPEGFITYTTNHANPALGFNVFVALFIHNIAEGFAMALPLFLAMQSRTKAIIWASLLGGLAQPAGAAIAWLTIRGRDYDLNTAAYGILFSITSGIMCSVGLQLFSQANQIYQGSRLTFIFAFIGMGLLGFSSALNAG